MILIDTNVVSETFKPEPDRRVIEWLTECDSEIAVPVIVIAEIAYGIERIRPDQRATRLARGLETWRLRFSDRICQFTEADALIYGEIMGLASRSGRPMTAPDGMTAAMAINRDARLATRNVGDFSTCGVTLVNPWSIG